MKTEPTIYKTREEVVSSILNKNGAKLGVEIGVFKGEFSRNILDRWDGTLCMIDPWRPLGEEYMDSSNHALHTTAYSDTMKSIGGLEKRAIMIRALSEDAVHLFQDESLDYVYVDGNHAYDYVKQDIEMWWPKLKPGGLLAGHDYLLVNWEDGHTENGKDKHVYADGYEWATLPKYDPNFRIKYAGVFGVNAAVHEFAEKHGLDYDLTEEWTSTFIIKKPLTHASK